MLRIQNLVKSYGNKPAVDNISFEAKGGEILGFLGPNGAGKSTTMKIACCYLSPDSGTAEVCGFDVRKNAMEVKRIIGYLPEHNPIYPDMYVHEFLRFSGSVYGIKGSALNKRVADIVEKVGLGAEQNKKIGSLSKGYRQRVGLAQALVHDPKVLILDEPTTGLDPNQIVEIRNLIREAGKEKTVIFSTHIMQEVQALCDRVVIINKGKIVVDNTLNALRSGARDRQSLGAEFERDIDADLLRGITGVIKVSRSGAGQYQIEAAEGVEIRSAVFRLAAENNLPLLGLQQQEETLETVFQRLTSN